MYVKIVIVTNHVNWHRENLRSDRDKNRENTGNMKMQFECTLGLIEAYPLCISIVFRNDKSGKITPTSMEVPKSTISPVKVTKGSLWFLLSAACRYGYLDRWDPVASPPTPEGSQSDTRHRSHRLSHNGLIFLYTDQRPYIRETVHSALNL